MSKSIEKVFSFVERHRKIILTIVIVFFVISILIPIFLAKSLPYFSKPMSRIEVAEIIAQIIAAFFVVIGSFIAVSQYYISSRGEIIQIETNKIDKAIKLTEYYKDEILKPYIIIKFVYKDTGLFNIMHKEKNKMKDFDEIEMEEIFDDKALKKIKNIYESEEFKDSIIRNSELLDFDLQIKALDINFIKSKDNNKEYLEVIKAQVLNTFRVEYITRLLNNIEFFSMYFTHNIADESVIYQSIYPTYLEICRTMYYVIAKSSKKGGPKLYRNLTILYNIWLDKSNKNKKAIRDNEKDMGRKVNNIRETH